VWNVCAANVAARRLFGGWIGGEDRNLLRYVFLCDEARNFLDDWEGSAQRILAEFRAESVRGDKNQVELFVKTLRADSADFERLWHSQRVLNREGGLRRFHHPLDGVLDFDQVTLGFTAWPAFRLVTLTPVDRGECGGTRECVYFQTMTIL